MPKSSSSSAHDAERQHSSTAGRDVDDENFVRPGASSKAGYEKRGGAPRESRREDDAGRQNERLGEQGDAQRQESAAQMKQGNFGGQDSRDQSPEARFSGHGAREARPSEAAAQRGDGAELEHYASDTRDNFSRMYAEHQRREAEKR